jgi:catechol 2,3-dioxygenase-like lactoylglutathione lyase family enzyme
MTASTRIVVAAVAGALVGSYVTAQVIRGQASRTPTPADGVVNHLGFAVTDVEKTAQAFGAAFNIQVPKAQNFRNIPWGPRFPGKVMHVRYIGFEFAGVSWEFQQPLEGDSPWKDFIAKHGDGLQHVGISVDDPAKARDYLESKGGKQTQAFQTFNYVDMSGAGLPFSIENMEKPRTPSVPAAK